MYLCNKVCKRIHTSDEHGDPGHCGAAQSHQAAGVHVVLVAAGVGRPGEVVQTRRQRLIEETISTHTQSVPSKNNCKIAD